MHLAMNRSRTLFLVLFCSLSAALGRPAQAQSYLAPELLRGHNPGLVNPGPDYSNSGAHPPGWTLIVPQGNPAAPWSAVLPLPFAFQCFGQPVTAYKVASSGILTFSTAAATAPPATPAALPSALVPDLSVCVWPQGFGNISTKTFGVAPHRQLWVSFGARWAIILEETSNAIYVINPGNQYAGNAFSIGVQRDATLAVQVPGSPLVPDLGYPFYYSPSGLDDNYYYSFRPTPLPVAELALIAHALPPVVDRRTPLVISGTFRNQGSQPLTAYRVGYQINGGPAVLSPVLTHAPVSSLDTVQFRHPLAWQPATRGTYRVKVWASPAPGAAPDPYPLNDTLQATVLMADSTMRRTVALESFGSSTCSPCGAGNANVRAVNRPLAGRYVEAHYQQAYPGSGDPYNTPEATNRMNQYYGYTGGIPATVVDGRRTVNSLDYRRSDFEQAALAPATVRINAAYEVVGRTVRAVVQVRSLDQIGPQYQLTLAVIERRTVNNSRLFSEPVFYNVFRKFMPSYPLSVPELTSGQSATFSQSYTFPANNTIEHFDSLRVMVLVQHRTRRDLLQAAYATLNGPLLPARPAAGSGPAFAVWPNPSNGPATATLTLARPQTVRLEVFDALGRCVSQAPPQALGSGAHTLPLGLSGQRPGLYLVRLTGPTGASTQRLVLE